MNNILNLLLEDEIVKKAIRKRTKLNQHVQYYLNNNYRHLVGLQGSNCVYVLTSALLPALLAYENALYKTGDLFASGQNTSFQKRGFFSRKTDYNDLGLAFNFICGFIEKSIPNLETGIDSTSIPEEKKIDKLLYTVVKEYATSALKRNKNDLASFWIFASCYYRSHPKFVVPLFPSSDNPLQLRAFDIEDAKRLETLCHNMLDHFCKKYRVINAMKQESEGKPVGGGGELENSVYYTQQGAGLTPLQFAIKCQFPDVVKDELARDLFGYSMQIETWENFIYMNPETHVFEYIPRKIACYYQILKTYGLLFRLLKAGDDDMASLTDAIEPSFMFYIANIHLNLASIYTHTGHITENAEYILAGIRGVRRRSPVVLVSARGGNIWQDGIATSRRRGHKFW